jgi:hypothetical protein
MVCIKLTYATVGFVEINCTKMLLFLKTNCIQYIFIERTGIYNVVTKEMSKSDVNCKWPQKIISLG